MVTFRNNNTRRNSYRRNERSFKVNGDRNKYNNNFSNSDNFPRKISGRNNRGQITTRHRGQGNKQNSRIKTFLNYNNKGLV